VCRNTQSFKKSERLKRKTLFNNLFKKGRYFNNTDFSLRLLSNNLNILRLGISIQKDAFPKAIQRNRIKRLIREVFRKNKQDLNKGYDILIRPKKPDLINSRYKEIEKGLMDLFKTTGVLKRG